MQQDVAPVAPSKTLADKRARGQRGQSMVEMALVLPFFLVIVMATIDFGWALRSYIVTTNAAREGARVGAVGYPEAEIKDRVVEKSTGILDTTDVTVTYDSTNPGAPGTDVVVSVDYDHSYISPLGPLLSLISGGTVPDPLPISTSTTMRIE